jgi:hypothetical protein
MSTATSILCKLLTTMFALHTQCPWKWICTINVHLHMNINCVEITTSSLFQSHFIPVTISNKIFKLPGMEQRYIQKDIPYTFLTFVCIITSLFIASHKPRNHSYSTLSTIGKWLLYGNIFIKNTLFLLLFKLFGIECNYFTLNSLGIKQQSIASAIMRNLCIRLNAWTPEESEYRILQRTVFKNLLM